MEPPLILGQSNMQMRRIIPNRILTDSDHHQNGEIKRSIYSPELKLLFTLDALSNGIKIFGKECKRIKEIKPAASLNNKDLIIINFSYSSKTQRVSIYYSSFI